MKNWLAIVAIASAVCCARQPSGSNAEPKPAPPKVATSTIDPVNRPSEALQGTTIAAAAAVSTDVAKLQAENDRLTAEVARLTVEIDRLSTELKALAAAPSASAQGVSKKLEALASLRAVRSILAGGAAPGAFKAYQLDSKIKVDALPDTPDMAAIREVSRIYADASTLLTSAMTQSLEAEQVAYFKKAYGADRSIGTRFLSALAKVPDAGFTRSAELTVQLEAISVEECAQYLLVLAQQKLDAIK